MLSSIPSYIKWLVALVVVSIVLILSDRFFLANTFIDAVSEDWRVSLLQKNTSFFERTIPEGSEKQKFLTSINIYERILEPKTVQERDQVFFSFLGIKQNSSVLHNAFGAFSISARKDFVFMPSFSARITKSTSDSITIQNTSGFSYPLDGVLLILPSDAQGTAIYEGNLLDPQENATIYFEKSLPKELLILESLSHGFKVQLSME